VPDDGRRAVEATARRAASQSGRGADPAGESVHTLTMEGRLPSDLDNDPPYGEETERPTGDGEAGRPIGKAYTAEEYLRHLDQLPGDEDAGQPAK